jgi:hypothetical protein
MTRRHREPHPQELYVVLFGEDSTSPEEKTGRLLDSLVNLPERNGRMLKLRYGIKTGISWTLAEIGREYGLSRERVRQIVSKSLQTLRAKCDPDSFLNLGLSGRAVASLKKAGIQTIKDLAQRTESDLLIIQGFGTESLNIIKIALFGRRLSLGSKNGCCQSIVSEMIEVDPEWDVFFLRLSTPAFQCLRFLRIEKIADLIGKTEKEFLSHRSGGKCLREILNLFDIEKLSSLEKLNVKKELFPPPHYLPLNLEEAASRLEIPLSNLIEGIQKGLFKSLPLWRVGKGWKGLRCEREDLDDWIKFRNIEKNP